MKKLALCIAAVLLSAGSAVAAPYVVSDSFTASLVEQCVVVIDGTTNNVAPETTTAGQARCVYDVAGVSNGAHAVAMYTTNVWGASDPVPFEFTKELPPTLQNIRLEY